MPETLSQIRARQYAESTALTDRHKAEIDAAFATIIEPVLTVIADLDARSRETFLQTITRRWCVECGGERNSGRCRVCE